MSWDGMIGKPGSVPCKGCGKPLNADGGHPAELYLGTYNGLCYACTGAQGFDTGERTESGAQVWDHPPHCPSWRRDRERFLHFPDCTNPKCSGGRVWKSRADAFGGSYTVQCEECGRRHREHPATVAQEQARQRRIEAMRNWEQRMELEYSRRCKAAGIDPLGDDEARQKMADAVLADGPPRPEGETFAAFPTGWPDKKPKRRRKK